MSRKKTIRGSLFTRIFLFFWLAMTVIGATFAAIYVYSKAGWIPDRKLAHFRNTLQTHGAASVKRLRQQGPQAAEKWNRALEKRLSMRILLYHRGVRRVGTWKPSRDARSLASRARRDGRYLSQRRPPRETYALPLSGPELEGWVILADVRHRTIWAPFLKAESFLLAILVVFLVSGLICYLLARHISNPIRRLRLATQKLAQGDLEVRIGDDLHRSDETGALGRDFDQMASRIQVLLEAQNRLLRDISHELRSPLARLNVALGLARQKAGDDAEPSLDRIEKEAERLNELIGFLTTLTRLNSDAGAVEREPIDLTQLLQSVAQDTSYEGAPRKCSVVVNASEQLEIRGSWELLRRAVENVIRNGLHHTADTTDVEVQLTQAETDGQPVARICVRDHGPGVPEKVLDDIFQPFFRVSEDRGRDSGGFGLGLAISRRAVHAHGGNLSANNVEGYGLEIVLELPLELPPT